MPMCLHLETTALTYIAALTLTIRANTETSLN